MNSILEHPLVQQKLRELQQTITQVTDELSPSPLNYPQIEDLSHQVGQTLAQSVNQDLTHQAAHQTPHQVVCPTCSRTYSTQFKSRQITTLDGTVEITEPYAKCTVCRRDFFPSA